jgi:hypothetical protein
MAHLKRRIVEVKSYSNCLEHAIVIDKARLETDPEYDSYRRGRRIIPEVENLMQTTGIDLQNGRGIAELEKFQEYLR